MNICNVKGVTYMTNSQGNRQHTAKLRTKDHFIICFGFLAHEFYSH